MLTLYGSNKTRSFRALWALEEAGLDYDYKQVRVGRTSVNGTQTDSYKKLNPQGKVPTLVDGDLVICESAAILNYIASLVPDKNLMPIEDRALRAKYDQLCFFSVSELEQPLWTYAKHSFILPSELRLQGIQKTSQWEFSKVTATLESLIKDNKFAMGEHFTMADILIAHTLDWAHSAKFDMPDTLLEYRNRMYQRPACQKAIQKA